MTIAEVSKRFGLTADTLRYYERIGLIPAVPRTSGGIRSYTEEDCNWINFAKCMRGAGLQVEALIEYVALFQKGDSTREARKQILIEQRDQLRERVEQMQQTLKRLDGKIEGYEQWIASSDEKLRSSQSKQ
ncbi:MerR family transcriptional regulator [Candidatus Soleaferrea massiliensis]|uniref:MerR family transcriptional regulator n=1 Tax=Candidatus Soleaferrea massiliensis TaxID=1470354 RepID=UPI00058EB498|nr:MerR family transcriptional regulator [Candidatus Soleaferrea massiliensis]